MLFYSFRGILVIIAFYCAACDRDAKPKLPAMIAYGQAQCAMCERVIADRTFAAQVVMADGSIRNFDDPVCALRFEQTNSGTVASLSFHTFKPDLWASAPDVWFVQGPQIRSPSGLGWAVVRTFGEAQAEVTSAGRGEVLSYTAAREKLGRSEPSPVLPTMTEAVPDATALFAAECAGCHGEDGRGGGLMDPTVQPQPRSLADGKLKYRFKNPRQPTTTAEVGNVILRGVPGTSMPAYGFLSSQERQALARRVLEMAGVDLHAIADPIAVQLPPPVSESDIRDGHRLFVELDCVGCHGETGAGDGPAAASLRDEWGRPARQSDLRHDPLRGGDRPEDVFIRLTIGVPGTPMGSYAEVTNAPQRWSLVRYLESIRRPIPLPTNPRDHGKAVYDRYQCQACHRTAGQGGTVGPPLDGVAARHSRQELIEFLLDPRKRPPPTSGPSFRMPRYDLEESDAAALTTFLSEFPAP